MRQTRIALYHLRNFQEYFLSNHGISHAPNIPQIRTESMACHFPPPWRRWCRNATKSHCCAQPGSRATVPRRQLSSSCHGVLPRCTVKHNGNIIALDFSGSDGSPGCILWLWQTAFPAVAKHIGCPAAAESTGDSGQHSKTWKSFMLKTSCPCHQLFGVGGLSVDGAIC